MFIVLTGPSGVGKTTLSENLALSFDRAVNIDLDVIKHFVVKGFKYDESLEGERQWQLLGKNAAVLIENYLDQNYVVFVNGYVGENTWNEIFKRNTPKFRFLLLTDEETNLHRDKGRTTEVAMGQEAVLRHRDYFLSATYFDDFIKLDTTGQSAEESLKKIIEIINNN